MTRACPYCGNLDEDKDECTYCKKDIKWLNSLNHKSEVYYAKAYYYAKRRELTTAISLLKKSIAFNAYHIDAKNLLGLIYFEIGNVGEALKFWILSNAIKKEGNKAIDYIDAIQNDLKKLERYKEAGNLYNQSLRYLHQKNEDMAIIRLKKAVGLNEHFIEAKNLLALCYIYQKQFYKATEQIAEVLKIDHDNIKALYYLNSIRVEESDGEEVAKPLVEPPRLNKSNQLTKSYKPQKIINRGHVLLNAVLYFIFGALCMFGIQVALVLPSKTESLKMQLYEMTNIKSQLEIQLETVKQETSVQINTLEGEMNTLKNQNEVFQKDNNKINQQNKLAQTRELSNQGEWVKAAEILYNISSVELSAEDLIVYEDLKERVLKKAAQRLYDTGYGFYRNGKNIEAVSDFEKVILYSPSTWVAGQALYYMGEMQEKDNIQKAKQHYTTLISDYKDTDAAYKAQRRLDKLGNQN